MNATTHSSSPAQRRRFAALLWGLAALWFAAVVVGAESRFLASVWMPSIAGIVALSIALPTLWYFASPTFRTVVEGIGHRRLMIMHAWRVPAALLFFWYGAQGQLPLAFWVVAGTGDLIAGSYAIWLAFKPESADRYRAFHRLGFADFVVAVGTGLTFTLLQNPLMAPLVALPFALIPLFGVGISGASHLMAFDMLRRGVGFQAPGTHGRPLLSAPAAAR